MSHSIHTSEAIILSRLPQDNNVAYMVFTREFGLLFAQATGVRRSESKLRSALQEYSIVTISLVKGKSVWRITSAIPQKNIFLEAQSQNTRHVCAKVCSLVARLIQGQEKDEKVYDTLRSGLSVLSEVTSATYISHIEICILVRLLSELGYVAYESWMGEVLSSDHYDESVYNFIDQHKKQFVEVINKGLKESQL